MKMHYLRTWVALLSLVTLPAWAKYEDVALMKQQEALWHQRYDDVQYDPRDPFEDLNRAVYDFNSNVLDRHIVRPVAVWYVDTLPKGLRESVQNAVLNFEEPSSAVNNLLQGKFGWAANATGRFVVNSTVGLLGFFDVAQHMGMQRKLDGFDEVLGTWGVGNGPYLMLPALGPSTPRALAGDYVDNVYWPMSVLGPYATAARWTLKGLYLRAQLFDQEKLLEQSLDPYTFVKEAYFQRVAFAVYDGHPPEQKQQAHELDDYMDEIDGDGVD